jgi:ribosomal protein L11 methyltransferase
MQYIKLTFKAIGQTEKDILAAMLSEAGYDGFEETGDELLAYIEEPKYDETELKNISSFTNSAFETTVIPAQNWNALWESNFEPVVVGDFCTIRAHFHDIAITTPHDIVITPKMSFGTGHHATTRLMISLMKELDFKDKAVLDFGAGTGVLAILAEKLGAREILAIDNDEWPVENAIENSSRNDCKHITVKMASLENVPGYKADIVLANINRHILLKYMATLRETLNQKGILLLSGILIEDVEALMQEAAKAGFSYISSADDMGWAAMRFEKI